MSQDNPQPDPIKSQWCLVGNIIAVRSFAVEHDLGSGTKHFSGGTKVYCLPAQWGDGYDRIIVIGRHHGSKQFVSMIIRSEWVCNWRAKVIYNPEIIRRIEETNVTNWKSKEQVNIYILFLEGRKKQVNPNSIII
jgi:hypothetical protein